MAILSFTNLPLLYETVAPFGYKAHCHDACGGQSFSLEAVGETQSDEVFTAIENFFASHGMQVEFYGEGNLKFVAK